MFDVFYIRIVDNKILEKIIVEVIHSSLHSKSKILRASQLCVFCAYRKQVFLCDMKSGLPDGV